jgi:copper resistance protein B
LSLALALALQAEADAAAMAHHDRTYSFTLVEADYSRFGGKDVVNWDAEGWIGGDRHKFWWKSEGETRGARLEQVEVQALYSRNVWAFFDVQAGVRYDARPDERAYVVAGVHGLAPGFIETELHAFVGLEGDVSIRAKGSFDLRMTNRFVLQPVVETDFYLTDAPERLVADGLSVVETGVLARYEINRRVAPYVGLVYESRLGGSARLARAAGEDPGGWSVRGGIRVWY